MLKTNKPNIEVTVEFERNARGVKQFLKIHGYNPKDFSVRKRSGGYERALYIEIKDLAISLREIEKLVYGQFQRISYCEVSGEMLVGGNTFVFVKYEENIFEELVESKKEEAEQLFKKLKEKPEWDTLHVEKNSCKLYLSNNNGAFPTFCIRKENSDFHRAGTIYSPSNIAYALAEIEAH